MKYNILVLDGQGSFGPERKCTVDCIKFLERYSPGQHNFLYQSICEPLTQSILGANLHVVVLTYSALSLRYLRPRETYYKIRDAWSRIGDLDAVKLAFPQDDYHNTNELDVLFEGLGVDVVYSVVPDHMEMFYPRSSRNAELKGVLTGYVDDDSIQSMTRCNKHFDDRDIDIFQRVRLYTSYGGFCGYHAGIKGRMATSFQKIGVRHGLRLDISTRPEDVVYGDEWLRRLGNSRFSIGCEGGVSLWDRYGRYQDLVLDYVREHGDVPFEELEAACFPGEDGHHVFSAVSPRLFESAVMRCSQILVQGDYLGLLNPWEHYIPVREDLGDVEDAILAMDDIDAAKRRVAACQETIVENSELRYSSLAREVMGDVGRLSEGRGFRESGSREFGEIVESHRDELNSWRSWKECRPYLHSPIESFDN